MGQAQLLIRGTFPSGSNCLATAFEMTAATNSMHMKYSNFDSVNRHYESCKELLQAFAEMPQPDKDTNIMRGPVRYKPPLVKPVEQQSAKVDDWWEKRADERARRLENAAIINQVLLGASNILQSRANVKIAEQQQRDRMAAEQAAIYQQRLQQTNAANMDEAARRSQWEASRQQQVEAQQATSSYENGSSSASGQRNQQPQRRPQQPAPVVRVNLSHDHSNGGPDGRVRYVNVYAINTGNVPVDCDVWLRGAFWNERAGPAMGSDQALSSIKTQRNSIIGLKPGERRRALALSHHVDGSRFDYDNSCKVSFTHN